jgi:hypothetical protein
VELRAAFNDPANYRGSDRTFEILTSGGAAAAGRVLGGVACLVGVMMMMMMAE